MASLEFETAIRERFDEDQSGALDAGGAGGGLEPQTVPAQEVAEPRRHDVRAWPRHADLTDEARERLPCTAPRRKDLPEPNTKRIKTRRSYSRGYPAAQALRIGFASVMPLIAARQGSTTGAFAGSLRLAAMHPLMF